MPEPDVTTTEPVDLEQQPGAELTESSPPGKLKLLAFAATVVVAECLVAYLYIPTASGNPAVAGVSTEAEAAAQSPYDLEEQAQKAKVETVEIDLGEFAVTSFQPISNTTLRIDFHLFGTIPAEKQEDLEKALQDNMHRIRDQVIVTVRSSDLTDLTDAGLGLIKRKILEKINRALGKPYLDAVIFSDFSFIEQ